MLQLFFPTVFRHSVARASCVRTPLATGCGSRSRRAFCAPLSGLSASEPFAIRQRTESAFRLGATTTRWPGALTAFVTTTREASCKIRN